MINYADQTFRSSSFPTESLSPPRESVSRFTDGRIRIKMTYFNKEYAKIFVAFIGLILVGFQQNSFIMQIQIEFGSHHQLLFTISAATFSVLSGVLSYIYPAQNVLVISIFSTSVLNLANLALLDVFSIRMDSNFLMCLLRNTVFVTALPAFHGIWASLIQLHKSSVLHVPIVLYSIHEINDLDLLGIFLPLKYSTYKLVMVSLAWCAVWTYMIFKPSNDVPSYNTIGWSTASTLSNIPWKPMCTSMPVLAILISYACEALNLSFPYTWAHISSIMPNTYFRYTSIMGKYLNTAAVFVTMVFTLIVLEFYPEVRFTSTLNVRKFWTGAYFFSQGIFFYVCAFTRDTFIDNLFFIIYDIVQVLYAFGFTINHMDIGPRYASILCGLITSVNYFSECFISILLDTAKTYLKDDHVFLICIQIAIILVNLIVVIFYFVFASADIQPWAKTYEDGSQQETDTTPVLV